MGDGVVKVVVLARRVDDKLRLEFFQQGHHQFFQGAQEPLFPGSGRQGNVDGRPPGVGAAVFLGEAGAGIQGPAVLVHGDEQGVGIVPVDVLGAVPMVAVRIHDGDLFHPVDVPDVFDHDRFDIDVAESPVAVDHFHGVVSWRPNQGEGALHFLFHDRVRSHQTAARRNQVAFRGHGFLVRHAKMHALQVAVFGRTHPVFPDSRHIKQAFFHDLVLGV